MTSAEIQILRIYTDNAKAAGAHHPGLPTADEYTAALAPTADMCGVSIEEVKRVVRDNAVTGAC